MSWMTDLPDPLRLRERTMKSAMLPIGLANPLFYAFGAAATAGVAWWTLTRLLRPTNLEAVLPLTKAEAKAIAAQPETVIEAVAVPVVEPVVEATPEPEPVAVAAFEPESEPEVAPAQVPDAADDLTVLVGIGPRTAAALAEHGVTRFAHLAAWTEERMADFDAEMGLKRRSVRDAWLDQARAFAALN